MPEREKPLTAGKVEMPEIPRASNIIDAAANGTRDGLILAANVGAMLIAFIGLIVLLNAIWAGSRLHSIYAGFSSSSSLRDIFSTVFAPLGFIVGVPWAECRHFGYLIGTQISINEFVAYIELSKMIKAGILSERTITLASYALCGFCNFSSIAIQIGGIADLVPERRAELAKLGPARDVLRQPRLFANRDHRRNAHQLTPSVLSLNLDCGGSHVRVLHDCRRVPAGACRHLQRDE